MDFAALARYPSDHTTRSNRRSSAEEARKRVVAALGLQQTLDTKVGSSFVQGVSGGERKRTSIAEVLVGGSLLQCWDNSTRGLDSASALQFVQTLRQTSTKSGSVAIVTLYQASQEIYGTFDKVALLYEGRQIYFGTTAGAKQFFVSLGFTCPERSTTSEFLCSLTNPLERSITKGHESRVPRTSEDFARIWDASPERKRLSEEIGFYEMEHPIGRKSFRRPSN